MCKEVSSFVGGGLLAAGAAVLGSLGIAAGANTASSLYPAISEIAKGIFNQEQNSVLRGSLNLGGCFIKATCSGLLLVLSKKAATHLIANRNNSEVLSGVSSKCSEIAKTCMSSYFVTGLMVGSAGKGLVYIGRELTTQYKMPFYLGGLGLTVVGGSIIGYGLVNMSQLVDSISQIIHPVENQRRDSAIQAN